MIRIAIAEDDFACAQQIRQYLYDFGRETERSFQITFYDNGEDLVEHYQAQFDLLLLDIEMPFINGMDAARYIRRMDQRVIIIFITSLAQYAIQGYEVQALDYILKPVEYFSFAQRIKHALTYIREQTEYHLVLPIKGGAIRVKAANIRYFERQTYQLVIHTQDEIYTAKIPLQQIENDLRDYNFFRCNKGCLVNLAFVDGIQDGCAVVAGDLLPISRARKADFMAALNHYMGEAVY